MTYREFLDKVEETYYHTGHSLFYRLLACADVETALGHNPQQTEEVPDYVIQEWINAE